jgi:hypothetical protein
VIVATVASRAYEQEIEMLIPTPPTDSEIASFARELARFPNRVAWAAIQGWLEERCPRGLWRETAAAVWAERKQMRIEIRRRAARSS